VSNLKLSKQIPCQVVTPGSYFTLQAVAQYDDGTAFTWGSNSAKARLTVGSVSVLVTGSVSGADGISTVTYTWGAEQTSTLPANSWGRVVIYADPPQSVQNLFIGVVDIQTNAEVIT